MSCALALNSLMMNVVAGMILGEKQPLSAVSCSRPTNAGSKEHVLAGHVRGAYGELATT